MEKEKRARRDNLKPEYEYQPLDEQPARVVHVHHTYAYDPAVGDGRNQTAFVAGLICGIFGLWGVAHLINGKLLSGILWFMFGPILAGIAIAVFSTITLGVGILFAIPIWLFLVYSQAKSGSIIVL